VKASGTFDVALTPQEDSAAVDSGITRLLIEKRFHGDLVGESRGQMLSSVTPVGGSAGYVAQERVRGTLNGRSGEFTLQHSGLLARGAPSLTVTVVPDSGTGELVGLRGELQITVTPDEHRYDFEYTLG
jgi:hypothetical protein